MKKVFLLLFISFFVTFLRGQSDTPQQVVSKPIQQMPEFPKGQTALFKFLAANMKYPRIARKKRMQGKVFVGFIVEADGSITDIKIKKGIENCPELEEEALRVVKLMPKWKAGTIDGKPVRVPFTLPLQFKLE